MNVCHHMGSDIQLFRVYFGNRITVPRCQGELNESVNFCTQLKAQFNGASRYPLYQGPGGGSSCFDNSANRHEIAVKIMQSKLSFFFH